jgi:hypothetical protein
MSSFRRARPAIVLAGALLVLLVAASPAAAYRIKGSGLYATFNGGSGSPSGILFADRAASGRPHVHVTFVGLLPYVEQEAVFRSIDCTGAPADDNALFRAKGTADENGELTLDRVVSPKARVGDVTSIWTGGSPGTCVPVTRFVRVAAGDVNGDGALGLVKTGAGTLVLLMAGGSGPSGGVSIVVNGFGGNDQLGLRGSSKSCGVGDQNAVFTHVMAAHWEQVPQWLTAEQLVSLKSLRVKNMDTGRNLGCFPLSIIMANTEGD